MLLCEYLKMIIMYKLCYWAYSTQFSKKFKFRLPSRNMFDSNWPNTIREYVSSDSSVLRPRSRVQYNRRTPYFFRIKYSMDKIIANYCFYIAADSTASWATSLSEITIVVIIRNVSACKYSDTDLLQDKTSVWALNYVYPAELRRFKGIRYALKQHYNPILPDQWRQIFGAETQHKNTAASKEVYKKTRQASTSLRWCRILLLD